MELKDIHVGDEVTIKATVIGINSDRSLQVSVHLADGLRDNFRPCQIASVERPSFKAGDRAKVFGELVEVLKVISGDRAIVIYDNESTGRWPLHDLQRIPADESTD